MEKLKQLNKELQDIQSTLEEDGNFRLSEQLQNIIDEMSNLVEARVSPKVADTNNYEEIWNELKTWTENIGEWVHKENFILAMKQAEINGWNKCYTTYIEDNSIEP